jgi:unsaturated rhamnogalacturonyl hydrolase
VIHRWPDPNTITTKGWEYNNGIVLRGIQEVYRKTGDPRYLNYIRRFVDRFVGADGTLTTGREPHNLDVVQPGVLLLYLLQETGEEKYRKASAQVRADLATHPRNSSGGFWHKKQYPSEMWLDGIYMAAPFLVWYGKLAGEVAECADTAVFQMTLVARHTMDPTTGMLRHAWDADADAAWADAKTGIAPVAWSRGSGWYAMALVDVLGNLPAGHHGNQQLRELLEVASRGIEATQDRRTGLWHQVMDKGDAPGNWHETSGSAMFVYALKTAVDEGWLERRYLAVAERGYKGLLTYVSYDDAGLPQFAGAVEGMGVQKDYAGYIGKKRMTNSPHGLCAIMLAAARMEEAGPR